MFDLNKRFPEFYKFHGRRVSKKLSKSNFSLIKNKFQKYSIDKEVIDLINKNQNNLNLSLDNKFKKIIIEVGFGNGEYLIKNAIKNPNFLYIGSEVYINGIAKVLKNITNFKLNNVKLCGINFLYLLELIKSKTIDEIYFINPDPWPKKRHKKRRLLNDKNLISINKILKKDGRVFISTDSEDYFNDIKLAVKSAKEIDKAIFGCISDLDIMYGISNYQKKAILNKKEIYKIEIFRN